MWWYRQKPLWCGSLLGLLVFLDLQGGAEAQGNPPRPSRSGLPSPTAPSNPATAQAPQPLSQDTQMSLDQSGLYLGDPLGWNSRGALRRRSSGDVIVGVVAASFASSAFTHVLAAPDVPLVDTPRLGGCCGPLAAVRGRALLGGGGYTQRQTQNYRQRHHAGK